MNIKEQIAKDLLSIGAVFLRPEDPFTWAPVPHPAETSRRQSLPVRP